MAIAMIEVMHGVTSVQWIIRPLTEAPMRGALVGDRKASALAFGDSIDG